MNTEILTTDRKDSATIALAAQLLQAGRLVAFPTETVYGLGANALDPEAVSKIFQAKGRPSSNPLIVHVADSVQVVNVATDWPETAESLARRFWPGPLTIAVPKRPQVPDSVTAGGPTVAVRCPNHPVAQALLRACGLPIAAPSANRSSELSPTRAEHVWKSLAGRIDLILDGGPCPGGIESTVVDVTGERVRLLRPGPITAAMLEEVVEKVVILEKLEGIARSPGQLARHYSPKTKLFMVAAEALVGTLSEAVREGSSVGIVSFRGQDISWAEEVDAAGSHFNLTDNPQLAAARLYDALHELDESHLDIILVEEPPNAPEWAAIRDRLKRAAML